MRPAGSPRKKKRKPPLAHMSRAVCRMSALPLAQPPDDDMTRVCARERKEESVPVVGRDGEREERAHLERLDRVDACEREPESAAVPHAGASEKDAQNWLTTPPMPPATNRLELEMSVWSGTRSQYCAKTRLADSYDKNLMADSCSR